MHPDFNSGTSRLSLMGYAGQGLSKNSVLNGTLVYTDFLDHGPTCLAITF
jgi:hypothetical protein